MSRYYEILPTTDSLELHGGKGSASFSVRYVGDRPVEVRTQAVAAQGADSGWLRVESPAVRKMEPNETQTFSVAVSAPADAAPGRYGLRLDAVSVDNPDEEYARGPVVAFTVTGSEPPPPPSGFPWWAVITAAVLLVLVVGGVAWFVLSGNGNGNGNGNGDTDNGNGDGRGGNGRGENGVVVPDEPPVLNEGTLRLEANQLANLDEGAIGRRGADIWYRISPEGQRTIAPRTNARMAVAGRDRPSWEDCYQLELGDEPISLAGMRAGTYLCVRTNERRISLIRRLAVGFHGDEERPEILPLAVSYATWERPPRVRDHRR